MRENGMKPRLIRAGRANMFLSPLFADTFANITGCIVELYNTDGSLGAARGAGLGIAYYKDAGQAFSKMEKLAVIKPEKEKQVMYENFYQSWKTALEKIIE
jgi:xylulokinase